MAEIVKPKDLAKVLEAIPENQVANAAEELRMTPKQLSGFIKKPTGKAFQKIAETLDEIGEGINGAQKFVNKFMRREPTELEKVGAKAAQGGMEPPKVQPGFAKEEIKPPGETGFQLPGQPGGPLATTTQTPNLPATTPVTPEVVSPRMQNINQKLLTPGMQDAELVGAKLALPAAEAKQTTTAARPALQAAREEAQAPKMSTAKKAGIGMAAAGLAALGAGFSKEANAPQAVKDAKVDTTKDVAPLVDSAVAQQAINPSQEEVLKQQAAELDKIAESLESKLTKDYEKKQARVELMKLAETVMHGLVTAIGANALLQRGSPYAVDFSQGPKTDWNAEFDRLQKDYSTQMGAIMQKYKLESAEKRAAAAEAGRESRFERMMGMKEKQLTAEQQKKQTEELAKLSKEQQTQYKDNLKNFALLSEAVNKRDTGNIVEFATKLGAEPETIDQLKKGKLAQGLAWLTGEKSVQDVLQGLRPQKPGAPAAAPAVQLPSAVIDPNGIEVKRPPGMADAQWKATVDTIEATWAKQDKKINKRY